MDSVLVSQRHRDLTDRKTCRWTCTRQTVGNWFSAGFIIQPGLDFEIRSTWTQYHYQWAEDTVTLDKKDWRVTGIVTELIFGFIT